MLLPWWCSAPDVVTVALVTVWGSRGSQQERRNVVMSELGMIYMGLCDRCQHNIICHNFTEFLTDID